MGLGPTHQKPQRVAVRRGEWANYVLLSVRSQVFGAGACVLLLLLLAAVQLGGAVIDGCFDGNCCFFVDQMVVYVIILLWLGDVLTCSMTLFIVWRLCHPAAAVVNVVLKMLRLHSLQYHLDV